MLTGKNERWRVDMNNQVKLIDAEKLLEWAANEKFEGRIIDYWGVSHEISAGTFDPDTPPVPTIKPGDKARHPDLGEVVVQWVGDNTAEVAVGMAHYDVSLKDLEVVE